METRASAINSAADPISPETYSHFEEWCARIARDVAVADPALTYAFDGAPSGITASDTARNGDRGLAHFSNQFRFVVLKLLPDGTVWISGLGAVTASVQPGQRLPHATELFPSGHRLIRQLSLNDEGAELATRAIVAWLSWDDDDLEAIRSDFDRHHVRPLRTGLGGGSTGIEVR